MDDEELEAIANKAYELTDMARQVLRAEITRRHLEVEYVEQPPVSDEESPFEEELPSGEEEEGEEDQKAWRGYPEGFDPEDWELVPYAYVDDIEEARKLKECFEAAGIPSYFGPDVVDDLRLLPSPLKGSLQVKIREVDLGRAREAR